MESFTQYARRIKFLLAETFGLRAKTDSDEDFYFGGSYFAAQIIPPPRLIESLFRGRREIKFLLNDDNYFLSMRNMWADFRNNMASRKNFDLRKLPALHEQLIENSRKPVSEYDIVAINAPWLGEAVKKNLILPLDAYIKAADHLLARFSSLRSGRWASWRGQQFGVPIYCTIELLAARTDLFEKDRHRISHDLRKDRRRRQAFPCARQGAIRHRLERRARHADRLDLHVPDGLLRRIDPARSRSRASRWASTTRRASNCGRRSTPKPACACSTICSG